MKKIHLAAIATLVAIGGPAVAQNAAVEQHQQNQVQAANIAAGASGGASVMVGGGAGGPNLLIPSENANPMNAPVVAPVAGAAPAAEGAAAPTATLPVPVASDFIRRQSEAGANIMEVQRTRAQIAEFKQLMQEVGVDTAILLMPEIAVLENSTVALTARIAEMQQINSLTQAILEGQKIIEAANAKPEAPAEQAGLNINQVGSSGAGDLMGGPVDMGNGSMVSREEMEQRLAALEASLAAAASSASSEPGYSSTPLLSEIYGQEGNLIAVMYVGGNEQRLRTGDTFQGNTVVSILRDQVILNGPGGDLSYNLR